MKDFFLRRRGRDNLKISISQMNDYDIFFIKGDYVGSRKPGVAKKILKNRRKKSDLIVDFRNVKRFDTSGLASLVSVWRKVKNEGGNFYITRADKRIVEYCEVCQIYRFFDFYDKLKDCFEEKNSTIKMIDRSKLIYQ